MGYGVFIHRSDSIYDDSPAERYHFPRVYLNRARACIGDWVLYYEPVHAPASRGYYAVARVSEIIEDQTKKGMFYALIAAGSFLQFSRNVPFSGPDGLAERGLLNDAGRISGRAQAAVRPISPADFESILSLGLDGTDALLPRDGESNKLTGFSDQTQADYDFDDRGRVTMLTSRIWRDRVFRQVVLRAYGERCAVTGVRLINGGGRAEVQAAHIRPVEQNGPDTLGNGIALSGTAHWMFDRGLISVADDLTILVSRQVNNPDDVRSLVNPTSRLIGPLDPRDRPHPHYLDWHRQNCFKH